MRANFIFLNLSLLFSFIISPPVHSLEKRSSSFILNLSFPVLLFSALPFISVTSGQWSKRSSTSVPEYSFVALQYKKKLIFRCG